MPAQTTRSIAGNIYAASPAATMALMQLGGHRDGIPQAWAIVDPDVLDELQEFRWVLSREYAMRMVWNGKSQPKTNIYLHRWIMGLEAGDPRVVDHINRDTLDNRRVNLRVVTRGQNLQNLAVKGGTSQYRGVRCRMGKNGIKWGAQCKVNGRTYHLGTFTTEVEAAEAARAYRSAHLPYSTD